MISNHPVTELAEQAGTILRHHPLVSAADGVITPVTTGFHHVAMRRESDGAGRIADLLAAYGIPFQESAETPWQPAPREITPLETPCPTC